MTTSRRRERNRNRARRARRRAERERDCADAVEVMRAAREERLARLGPFVEMYGDGSELLRVIDRMMLAQERGELPGWVVIAEGRANASKRPLRELLLAKVDR